MYKYFFGILCLVLASYSSASEQEEGFKYKKEIFTLSCDFDVGETPSLTDLCQQAKSRKTHFDELFKFISQHKLEKPVMDLFKQESDYLSRFSHGQLGARPIILARLKTDYATERDLLSFFSQCLEKITHTQQPTAPESFQTLYEQAAHVVRFNLQSVWEHIFSDLALNYPGKFIQQEDGYQKIIGIDENHPEKAVAKHDTQAQLFSKFIVRYRATDCLALDTVQIAERIRFLADEAASITCPSVIFELNSILFYLNIERVLLATCATLQFEPIKGLLQKDISTYDNIFVLAKLVNQRNIGIWRVMFQPDFKISEHQRQLESFNRKKTRDQYVDLACKVDTSLIEPFFYTIFPEARPAAAPAKASNQGPTKSNLGNKTKGGKKSGALKRNVAKTKKPPVQKSNSSQPSTLPKAKVNDALSVEVITHTAEPIHTASERHKEEEDLNQDKKHEEQDLLAYAKISGIQIPPSEQEKKTKKETPTPIPAITIPYECSVAYDHYVYKRNMTSRPRPLYVFKEQPHSFMEIPTFSLALLERLKVATELSRNTDRLPNLASFAIRLHFTPTVEDPKSGLQVAEFTSGKLYLSGAKYFDEGSYKFKRENKIVNAFHDVLTQSQQQYFLSHEGNRKGIFIGKTLEQLLRQKVVKGGWKDNCLDSEAILLLDLVDLIPKYLSAVTDNWKTPIHLHSIAIGISSYRDCCWRCRNLIQGFQWGLEDLIKHHDKGRGLITLLDDFSSVAITMGNIAPDSADVDWAPPMRVDQDVILHVEGRQNSKHKLTCVKT